MNSPLRIPTGVPVRQDKSHQCFTEPMASLPLPPPVTDPAAAAELLFSDGFVQIPDLFSPAEVADLRAWIDSLGGEDAQYDVKDWCFNKHLEADLRAEPRWLMLMDRDPVPTIVQLALGEGAICYGGSLWVTGKGRAMPVHADLCLMEVPDDLLHVHQVRVPIQRASLHIYLDDLVPEIGPTTVIPGSHRAGRHANGATTWRGIAPQMASVRAGGGLLFRHDVWHGAAPNTSTRRRYMIQVHYAQRWHHGPVAGFSPAPTYQAAVADVATPRQRALLGERTGKGPAPAY